MNLLSKEEILRYYRQILISGWGKEGQEKLKGSSVFIAGAGGLGSPAAVCLALAGVGKLRICDFDDLEVTNLNRQFLHNDARLGVNKALSAKITLSELNPWIEVEAISERIEENNVDRIIGNAEIIIDCLDNFKTRFILNSYSVKKGIPLIHGSILGFEGRVIFLHPPETACFSCIFRESPPEDTFPVFCGTPGVTGMIQGIEALKYLLGLGSNLKGRMLVCDFLEMKFFEINIRKDPHCPVCSHLL